MPQTTRAPEILELARRDGKVSVEALAAYFDVSVQTVRRDLSELADTGQLTRVHGGAVLPSGTLNIAHEERRALNAMAKRAIAQSCAAAIPEGAALALGIGTTTEATAQELLHHRGLMVLTNSLRAADILSANADAKIILTGGTLRRADGGLIGPQALETITQFRPDFTILGCSALTENGEMLDYDLDEIAANRQLIACARQKIAVVDHANFQRSAPAHLANLGAFDTVFTDRPLPDQTAQHCKHHNTKVHICPPDRA